MREFLLYLKATEYNKFKKYAPILVMSFVISFMEIFNLSLIYPILQFFMDKEGFENGRFILFLNFFIPPMTIDNVGILVLVLFLGLTVCRGIVSYLGYKRIFSQIAFDESCFATKEFEKLLSKKYIYFINTPSIQIIRDIAIAIPQGFSSTLQSGFLFLSELLVLAGMACLLLIANYQSFISLTLLFGAAGILYVTTISPKIVNLGSQRHNNSHKCIGIIQQSIEGIQQIKNSCAERYFLKIFSQHRSKQAQISSSLQLFQTVPKIYFETLLVLCLCGFLGYSLIFSHHSVNSMSVTVGFYAVTALRLLPSILRILAQYNNIISFKDAINVVTKLGNKENDVDIQTNRPVSFSHEISFENICFRYENNWILKNLTLNIRKNKCIGIFGKSGQGKTTFVNILAGLLSPYEGSIKIDSNDISFDDIREKLGNMVSYVPQNIYLIDKDLSSNIAFGQEEENIDYHAVTQTLRSADLSEFLDKEKQGANVKIGERGVGISGGQRQRIGIARALYFNRDIIIFDEATSSLDEETENRICETIQSLKKDKTIIIISHRKKPLAICDEVYEMKSGHLIKI